MISNILHLILFKNLTAVMMNMSDDSTQLKAMTNYNCHTFLSVLLRYQTWALQIVLALMCSRLHTLRSRNLVWNQTNTIFYMRYIVSSKIEYNS